MNLLSVSTYSFREQLGPIALDWTDQDGVEQTFRQDFPALLGLDEVPGRAARTFPVQGVEAVAFQFAGVDDPALDAFAAAAADAGLALLNVAVDTGDLLSTDPDRRAADVAELERWIDRLAALGSRFVRVNPGSPFSPHRPGTPPDHLVETLRGLGGHAAERGTRLLVENHGGPSSDPAWMLALLDAVGTDRLGLLLDLGNFDALLAPLMAALSGGSEAGDPFAGLDLTSLYAGIDALAGRAELVHVKAHQVGADGSVGPVDLPRALDLLAAHGYAGPLTVEYEGSGGDPWAHTGRVVELTRETVSAR